MDINITKRDIAWSYLAQVFNLGTGLITLPIILKLLSPEEVGFNYILISINSIVTLFDMGFSGQFARYLTYIFSGAQNIQKDGIPEDYKDNINEHLLACTITTARKIYFYISLFAFICLMSFGTLYIYNVTEGLTLINNALSIWCIFCISAFFNIYFLYYNSFLQSKGLIMITKKAQVWSRLVQILITFSMLFAGYGLLSVVVASLISPFIFRYISYKSFYTSDIIILLDNNEVSKNDIKRIFYILLHNAKKMGIISVLASAIGYASTLVIGKYMSLSDVGSYGLMVQLTGIVMGLASIHFSSIIPKLANLMVKKDSIGIKFQFGLSMFSFVIISLLGFVGVLLAPFIFGIFNFKTQLPNYSILIIYYVYKVIDQTQCLYSQLFLINNDLRFYSSAIITGIVSFISLYFSLHMGYGLIGVVLAPAITLYLYAAWKWPVTASIYFDIDTVKDIFINPICHLRQMIRQCK